MVTEKQITSEMVTETEKLYRDYPHLSIFDALQMAVTIISKKYKGAEIIEHTAQRGL